ncbi:MAG: hypothetical protein Salg2KO_22660 [Salibacteraceae bacterium]
MLTGLNHLHSANRYLVIGFIVAAIIDAIIALSNNKQYSKSSRMLALLSLIFVHIQLLVGSALYFLGDKGLNVILNVEGFMKIAQDRFYAVEHLVGMIVAITLITIGYSKVKRIADDRKKYRTVLIFFGLGLLIILVLIPWPFMKNFGSWI